MTAIDQVLALVRPEILALAPYSSARKESKGGRVWLDANENPETPSAHRPLLNRYPEPQPADLVAKLAELYGIPTDQALVTRGSDEGIDLLLRTFCNAGQASILITPPTYGMYVVAAGIQHARVVTVPLLRDKDFALDADAVLRAVTPDVKIIFLCSPNNPTGGLLDRKEVLKVVRSFAGRAIVAVDEAYVDFAGSIEPGRSGVVSLAEEIATFPNLVALRTLSKAFGLAGARVGTTIAHPAVIAVLQKVIAPYPVPSPVLQAALAALTPEGLAAARESVSQLIAERARLLQELPKLKSVKRVWPSDANFILTEVNDAPATMAAGRAAGIVWRDRSKDVSNTVRITVGTVEENNQTLEVLSRV
jgi:histidinol-phosphate aminotransferase